MRPADIRKSIAPLEQSGHHADFFTRENVIHEDDTAVYEKWDIEQRILDMAQAQWDTDQGHYPDNDFRQMTGIEKDGETRFYEIILTQKGEMARVCARNEWCCNHNGEFDLIDTLELWLWRASSVDTGDIATTKRWRQKHKDWLKEDWAKPIRDAFTAIERRQKVNRRGEVQMHATIQFWTTGSRALNAPHKDYFLASDEAWLVPIQEHIVHRMLSR